MNETTSTTTIQPSIYGLSYRGLRDWLEAHGEKRSRSAAVWEALYRQRATVWSAMTGVHAGALALLREHFVLDPLELHTRQEASDGTVKYLFRLQDGHLIETVLMRQKFGLSVCVTTQVGCNIGCSFCASGLLAKSRDLDSGEIMAQIMKVQQDLDRAGAGERVTHIVVMGIGEPFDNYGNLLAFLHTVLDRNGLAIGPKHITVSTSGLTDGIRRFADENLRVNLALSLHAPNNALRTRIMKINKAIPLEEVMSALDYFIARTNQRVTLEYILLDGVNDGPEQARELVDLIAPIMQHVGVNLIPYNPVDEHSAYRRSPRDTVTAFYDILKKHGVNATVRQEHGTDIDAACGQLRSKQMGLTGRSSGGATDSGKA